MHIAVYQSKLTKFSSLFPVLPTNPYASCLEFMLQPVVWNAASSHPSAEMKALCMLISLLSPNKLPDSYKLFSLSFFVLGFCIHYMYLLSGKTLKGIIVHLNFASPVKLTMADIQIQIQPLSLFIVFVLDRTSQACSPCSKLTNG
jgi:hypothetical protein